MTPEVWGKHLWFSMHFIAMCYPSSPTYEQRVNYKKFYENVWNVLPCAKCAIHYRNNLELLPLEEGDKDYLENNKTLFEWTVKMHNIVNVSLGKPQVTLEEAENFCTDIAIIDYGKILIQGSPKNLIAQNTNAKNLEDVFLNLTKRNLRDL